MKKYLLGSLIGAALMFQFQIYAEPIKDYVLVKIGYPILVNGKEYSSDDLPFLNYEGNTYAPLKRIGDLLGSSVKWNEKYSRVEIGSAPIDPGEVFRFRYSTAFKIGDKLYNSEQYSLPNSCPFATLNGKYFVQSEFAEQIMNLSYKKDYVLYDSLPTNPYFDGMLSFKQNETQLRWQYEIKYLDSVTVYVTKMFLENREKTKIYSIVDLPPLNVSSAILQNAIKLDYQIYVPFDEFSNTFGIRAIVDRDDTSKIISVTIK